MNVLDLCCAANRHIELNHTVGDSRQPFRGIAHRIEGKLPLLVLKCRRTATKQRARSLGVTIDNIESMKLRVNGRPFVKYDLGNQFWDSMCVYSDGMVYPSAATANGYDRLTAVAASSR